jgi:DNA-damage-inducible protein D
MNGDPRKQEIAAAQAYFTIQTRRMEVQDATLAELAEDIRRIELRDKVIEGNKALNQTAHNAGVRRFSVFHDAGYRGLYGMGLADIKAFKHVHADDDLLDVAGFDELAANAFRISQATQKIRHEGISDEHRAIDAHEKVGRIVRGAIKRAGGTMPEDLLPEAPIKEIKKRVKLKLGTAAKLTKPSES